MNVKYNKLFKNTALMFVGSFSSKLLNFFLVPFYTYYLSTSDYGTSDLIFTTVQLLTPILTVSGSEAVLRFTLDKKMDNAEIFSASTIILCIGFGVLLLISPFIYKITPFRNYYVYFLIYYLTYSIYLNLQQFVRGMEHIVTFVFVGILHTFITICSNIFFLGMCKMGIEGYLVATISGSLIAILFLFIKEKIWKYFINVSRIRKSFWKTFFLFSVPLIPNTLSWWISNSSDKFILQFFWGPAVTGIYAIAYKIPSVLTMISSIFMKAWQISAIDGYGEEETVVFFSSIYDKFTSLNIIFSALVISITKPLAELLFSKDFYSAWQCSIILVSAAMAHTFASFFGVIYTAATKTKMLFVTTIIGAGTNVLLNACLIPRFGAIGASLATLISYVTVWIIRIIDSHRIIPLKIKYFHKIICYFFLVIQSIIVCVECKYSFFFSIVIVLIICMINYDFIMKTLKSVYELFGRKNMGEF